MKDNYSFQSIYNLLYFSNISHLISKIFAQFSLFVYLMWCTSYLFCTTSSASTGSILSSSDDYIYFSIQCILHNASYYKPHLVKAFSMKIQLLSSSFPNFLTNKLAIRTLTNDCSSINSFGQQTLL